MRSRILISIGLVIGVLLTSSACSGDEDESNVPGMAPRGTTMTTAQPTRQDLTNSVSLAGKVAINPVFGLVAPGSGEIHFYDVPWPRSTPTKPTWAANVWAGGKATRVDIPAGATFAGRLVPDRTNVTAGMPIVSARYSGYGIVAEIAAADAYKISDGLTSVKAQIANGPGPFDCAVLGTIAALPGGIVPDPPPAQPDPNADPAAVAAAAAAAAAALQFKPVASEATGTRLVCQAPADMKLINGADATISVVTATVTNVLVLPVAAVAGSQGIGKVDIVKPDGTKETRDVTLGLTDGRVVEIKSGLTGDETVAIPGPNLPAAPPAANDPSAPVFRK